MTIPILRYANECQLVPKEREACTDYVTTTCKKVRAVGVEGWE